MNDLTRWVAESDPYKWQEFAPVCFYCDAPFEKEHAPGCRYVLAREQDKQQEQEREEQADG